MGLLNLIDRKQHKPEAIKALSQGSITYTGINWLTPQNNPTTYIDGYKTLPNLYGIISLITQKSSIVPFEVMKVKNHREAQKYKAMMKSITVKSDYKKIMKVKEQAFELVEGSDLEKLLLKPNSQQSLEELNEAFDGYLLLTGNAYLMAVTPGMGKNAKVPKELVVLPSTMTTPIAKNMEIKGFKVSYIQDQIDKELVGHARYFNPLGRMQNPNESLTGLSPLVACRNLIKKYENADIAQGSMFVNMGPSGILNGENGELTQEQAESVRDQFKINNTGVHKAGKITVTSAKMHWTQIGLSPVDLNIIEGKQEMLQELCNVYHLDIGIVTGESSTDNNMDNARKRTITDAVIPIVEKRKQIYNSWLAPKFGEEYILVPNYDIFPEMQEDIKEQAETAKLMDWLTWNEKRELTGYDVLADDNMNKVYMPSGLIPMDEVSLQPDEIDEEALIDNDALDS